MENQKSFSLQLIMTIFILIFVMGQFTLGQEINSTNVKEYNPTDYFSITTNIFTQTRFTSYKAFESDAQNNFDMALGRVALSGSALHPNASYFLQIEGSTFGNTNNVSFIDWWINYKFSSAVTVTMGRFILPYSRQFYTHPGNLLFTDLSSADYAFNLPRAVGVQVNGSIGIISYGFGTTNGVRALDAGGEHNAVNNSLSYFGRVEINILGAFGYLESSANKSDKPQLSVGIAAASNDINNDSGFQNVKAGDKTFNITTDLGLRYKLFVLQAAYYSRANNPNNDAVEDYTESGYYLQSGFQIIPKKIEVGGRYSNVELQGLPKTAEYTLGLNYYISGHNLKIQLDYSLIQRAAFQELDSQNDNRIRVQTQFLF